jgi:hypothetical protein
LEQYYCLNERYIGGTVLDDYAAREDLRLKLIEAEAILKQAEEEYDLFVRQLKKYEDMINEQKEKIRMIKAKSILHLQ